MKPHRIAALFAAAACAWAQSTSTTYQKDINGRTAAVASSATSAAGELTTERFQNVNGRQVHLEQAAERVLRSDSKGKLTERTIRKYDPSGRLASTERLLIEETPRSGGGSTVKETTFRSTINGSFVEAQRRTSEIRVLGETTSTEVKVERPGPNGGFTTAEQRSIRSTGPEQNQHTVEIVLRPDPAGRLREARREETTLVAKDGHSTSNTATYEPGVSGALQLAHQAVSTITKRPDGSELKETNLYSAAIPGRLQANGAAQQIEEQQILERRTAPNGAVVEVLSVRRPTLADPGRLGAAEKLSETVCQGKCSRP